MQKTNERILRSLLRNLNTIETAMLRERIINSMEISLQNIETNPEGWRNVFSPEQYKKTYEKILNLVK